MLFHQEPFLHLIDGEGIIEAPEAISRYLTVAVGGNPQQAPAQPPQRKLRAVSNPELRRRGFNYRVVGVFGGQSSGKSTLLNHLFATGFETMNEDAGRGQTTRGCFLGRAVTLSPGNHASSSGDATDLFVMDFEGTDGVERGENQAFEKQLSLFALSVADTLIVNMWANEVGRFNAANLSLLQTVFEVNLQLVAHEQASDAHVKPTLLFILRDHTAGPLDKLREVVLKSMTTIWERIGKPKCFANARLEDFFNLAFCALPHYVLQRSEFDKAVVELRSWFTDVASPAYLYKASGAENYRHIALDDVSEYLCNCWESIKQVKDLDIPSQREMLARVRCNDLAEVALADFEDVIKKRLAKVKDGHFVPNVTSWIAAGIRQRLVDFERETAMYAANVTKQALLDLQTRLEAASEPLIEAQCTYLSDALVRASDEQVQNVLDMAFNSVLPLLANEWYHKVDAARTAAAKSADRDGFDRAAKEAAVADAQRSIKVSATVTKWWDFVTAELNTVVQNLREKVSTSAAAAPANRSGRSTPVAEGDSPTTPASSSVDNATAKLVASLRGDSVALQRTLSLVQQAVRRRVVERLQFMSSDLSSTMGKAFEKVLQQQEDGTIRFLTTKTGLDKVFGPARATGLLLVACIAVFRAPTDGAAESSEASALVRKWTREAMHIDFRVDENPAARFGAPVYPQLPFDVDGSLQDDADAPTEAMRQFQRAIILDEAKVLRSYELFNQHCTFTYTLELKRIEAGSTSTPVWMWILVLLLGANEIIWLLTNPLMLIMIGAGVWFFFRNWVEAQWQRFEEAGPPQLVLPAKAALAMGQQVYSQHIAPLLGAANAKGKPKKD